jgi:hypothetical protein
MIVQTPDRCYLLRARLCATTAKLPHPVSRVLAQTPPSSEPSCSESLFVLPHRADNGQLWLPRLVLGHRHCL